MEFPAGLHLIIGAFLAGQFVRREIMDDRVYEVINDRFFGISYGFLVPIFFVSLFFHLRLSPEFSFIFFSATLIMVAVIGKLFGCSLGAALFGYSLRESGIIRLGMNGRGAVELVVASVVLELSEELMAGKDITEPLLTTEQFSALVLMALVTAIYCPHISEMGRCPDLHRY